MSDNQDSELSVPSPQKGDPGLRKRLFEIIGAVVVVGAIAFGLWWFFIGSRSVSTEDAYVGADNAIVTPLVSAPVLEVRVSDTQFVRKGDVLVVLDSSDARVALAQAEAELARAERRVRGYLATDASLASQTRSREADITRAQAQIEQSRSALAKTEAELANRLALVPEKAVASEEVTAARNNVVAARSALDSAVATYNQALANRAAAAASAEANRTLTAGSGITDNPEVASARAKRDQAALDLARTTLRAPFDGVVARRQVQVGQRVAAGANLMTIVPAGKLYVDANFKETQLRNIRVGQKVTLVSDTYGSSVTFHGKVIGRGAGTGSAFALIPAQNATGNWIKVIQRVPIRISLDPAELKEHPLAVGASMTAEVEID